MSKDKKIVDAEKGSNLSKVVVPRNNADIDKAINSLSIYSDEDGWLSNEEFIRRYKARFGIIGSDSDQTQYTKAGQTATYFGFIEWENNSSSSMRRITPSGKRFLSHYQSDDREAMQEDIMLALETVVFGRNNYGVISSDTDVEVPALYLRAATDLGYLTNQESAFLIYKLSDCGMQYTHCIRQIRRYRENEEKIEFPQDNIVTNYGDNKAVKFLENLGILVASVDIQGGKTISRSFYEKYASRIKNLKIYSIDKNVPMEKMTLKQVSQIVGAYDFTDYSAEYEYFKKYYSMEVLSSLSDDELAVRLFASSDYAKAKGTVRGFAIWAEHGTPSDKRNAIPFGMAKGHTGGQTGVVLKADGTYHVYEYSYDVDSSSGKSKKQCNDSIIDKEDADFLAAIFKDTLERICKFINGKSFANKADYENLLEFTKATLVSASEERLYWNKDGDPDGIFMKYLHCSFPGIFGCWYSKDRLKKLLLSVYEERDLGENALVLNGQLSLLANSLEIDVDNVNFGVIWGSYIFGEVTQKQEEIDQEETTPVLDNDNEVQFRAWMSTQISAAGTLCTPSMISANCSALKKVCAMMDIIEYPDVDNLFSIEDIDTFIDIKAIIRSHVDFDMVNKACGNGFLKSALNWYEKYLNEKVLSTGEAICESKPDPYGKSDFLADVFLTQEEYDKLHNLLLYKKNIILQGAPGVGKTYLARRFAYSLIGAKDDTFIEMVQFHQNYGYEDFIMGFRPTQDSFELQSGSFYNFCKKVLNDPDKSHKYFFIIDEINRGNLSKIFGELLMLIEADKRGPSYKIKLAYKDESFFVPENLYIIGMMNTADRSLAMMDYALRRRFSFFNIEPAFGRPQFRAYLKTKVVDNDAIITKIIDRFKALNEKIADEENSGLGKGFCIGHSYFCNPPVKGQTPASWYAAIIEYEVSPLLDEYWWDDKAKAEDCKKELARE